MVATLTAQDVMKIPVDRVWRALGDGELLLPKVVPDIVSSIKKIEGDGGPGTVRLFTFGPGMKLHNTVKERIDVVDSVNHLLTYTVIEGQGHNYSHLQATVSFAPSADDNQNTIASWKVDYVPVGDMGPPEHVKTSILRTFKAVENYLLAHPEEYV